MENLMIEEQLMICLASLGLLPLLAPPSKMERDQKKLLHVLPQSGLCLCAGMAAGLAAPVLSVSPLALLPPFFLLILFARTLLQRASDQQRMQQLSDLSICLLLFCIFNEALCLFLPCFWAVFLAQAVSGLLLLPFARESAADLQRFVPSGTAFLESLCALFLLAFFPAVVPTAKTENTEAAIVWTGMAGLMLVLLFGNALYYRIHAQLQQTMHKSEAILKQSESCFDQNCRLLARQHDAIQAIQKLEQTQTDWQPHQKVLFTSLHHLLSQSSLTFESQARLIAGTAGRYQQAHPDLCIGIQLEIANLSLEEDLMISQILDGFLQNHLQFSANEPFFFQIKGDERMASILCICRRSTSRLRQKILPQIQECQGSWQIQQEFSVIHLKRKRPYPAETEAVFPS